MIYIWFCICIYMGLYMYIDHIYIYIKKHILFELIDSIYIERERLIRFIQHK